MKKDNVSGKARVSFQTDENSSDSSQVISSARDQEPISSGRGFQTSFEVENPNESPQGRRQFMRKGDFTKMQTIKSEDIQDQIEQDFKKATIFPVFDFEKLSKISMSHYIYFALLRGLISLGLNLSLLYLFCYALTISSILIFSEKGLQEFFKTGSAFWVVFITSFIQMVMTKIIKSRISKQIASNKVIYDQNWTQDKFSLIMTGIPFGITPEKLIKALNKFLENKGCSSKARKVIRLQECSKYVKLQNQLKQIEKELIPLDNEKQADKAKRLSSQKQYIEEQMEELEAEYRSYKHFSGRAIVTFNTIKAKALIEKNFPRDEYSFFGWCCPKRKQVSLFGANNPVYIERAYEPLDCFYHNLGFTPKQRFMKSLKFKLLWCLSLLVAILFILALTGYSHCLSSKYFQQYSWCELVERNAFLEFLIEYGVGIVIFVVGILLNQVHGAFSTYNCYPSKTKQDSLFVDYVCITSYLTYIVLFIPFLVVDDFIGINQTLIVAFAALFLKRLLNKLIRIGLLQSWMKKKNRASIKLTEMGESSSQLDLSLNQTKTRSSFLLQNIQNLSTIADEEKKPFNFMGSLTDLVPITFMMIAFSIVNPLAYMLVSVLIFYGTGLADKFILVKYSKPAHLKSIEYAMNLLKPLQWDGVVHLSSYAGMMIWFLIHLKNLDLSDDEVVIVEVYSVALVVFYLLISFISNEKIKQRVRARFEELDVNYDDVSKDFNSFYADTYPLMKFQAQEMRSASSSLTMKL